MVIYCILPDLFFESDDERKRDAESSMETEGETPPAQTRGVQTEATALQTEESKLCFKIIGF